MLTVCFGAQKGWVLAMQVQEAHFFLRIESPASRFFLQQGCPHLKISLFLPAIIRRCGVLC